MATNALVCLGPIKKMGRPSTFSDEVAGELLARLWEGESLTSICQDDDMPALRTVYKWIDARPDFGRDYAQARARQADTFAEQMQDVASDLRILPEHKRIMIDVMKWRAARQNWRAWGDKVSHEHNINERTAAGQEQLPEGLGFLARFLPGSEEQPG